MNTPEINASNAGTLAILSEMQGDASPVSLPVSIAPLPLVNTSSPWSVAGRMDREKMRLLEIMRGIKDA